MPNQHRSIAHILLAGMILSAIPALTLARQSFASPTQLQLKLPATLTQVSGGIEAKTEINKLDLNQLAGSKNVAIGDVVYVHLNVEHEQADSAAYGLSYAYAVTQNRPQLNDKRTISLRGVVTGRSNNIVFVKYLFEALPPTSEIKQAIGQNSAKADITIAVNRRAVGHLKSVTVGGQNYSFRH